jgi:hypothetical protein
MLGAVAVFVVPSIGPGTSITRTVTFAVDPGLRGPRTITAATASSVRDPDPLDNAALARIVVG